MEKTPELGKWYYANVRASYGETKVVLGQCMAITEAGLVLRYFDNTIVRDEHFVQMSNVLDEGKDPRVFAKICRMLNKLQGDEDEKSG
jgi:hypothetical protein